jgi:hypothetical protein
MGYYGGRHNNFEDLMLYGRDILKAKKYNCALYLFHTLAVHYSCEHLNETPIVQAGAGLDNEKLNA